MCGFGCSNPLWQGDLLFIIIRCKLLPGGGIFLNFSSMCPHRDEALSQRTAMVTIYPVSFPLQIIPQLFRSFPRRYSPFSLISLETLWLMTRSTLVSLQLQEAMCLSRQVWGQASSLVCGCTEPGQLYLLCSSAKLEGGCLRRVKNHFLPAPCLSHQEQSKDSP